MGYGILTHAQLLEAIDTIDFSKGAVHTGFEGIFQIRRKHGQMEGPF
jgi:hypothetical protein